MIVFLQVGNIHGIEKQLFFLEKVGTEIWWVTMTSYHNDIIYMDGESARTIKFATEI